MDINNLKNSISPYEEFCDGYGNYGASGNSYVLGLSIGVGVVGRNLSNPGSNILDEINAFDMAEIDGPYIGQLNMSQVSSFCGPQGLIWGYDIAKSGNLYTSNAAGLLENPLVYKGESIKVCDGNSLIDATKTLFGTIDNKRFNLKPGAHVPFAGKYKNMSEKGTIYAGVAIGISKDRKSNACLLMEDVGVLNSDKIQVDTNTILKNLAKSVIEIGHNQKVEYSECFVAIKTCEIAENQIGCALVAAPYFTLAKNAVLKNSQGSPDFNKMFNISLSDWEKSIFGNDKV